MLAAAQTLDLSAITSALSESLSVATITDVVGTVITASMGLYLVWWGARKLVRATTSAFSKGKVSV